MDISKEERLLLEWLARSEGGLVANSELDKLRMDALVGRGLAIKQERKPLLPGSPQPGPIYRISDLGRAAL
jgi:hypothetical protein